jgi:hypothetical protein
MNKDQQFLTEAYEKILNENDSIQKQKADQLTNTFKGIASGIGDASLRRPAILASQGKYDEAEDLLKRYITDPSKFKIVADAMKKTLKPIPDATSSRLEADKPYNDWLDKGWIPWVKQYI